MIVPLAARGAQVLFAIVILILSIVLITGYGPGHNPSLISYGAFCGAGGLLFAIIGLGAVFFDAIQGIIILALDGIAAFFLLAGGLAFAIQLKVGRCTDFSDDGYVAHHLNLFAPSSAKYENENDKSPNQIADQIAYDLKSRCQMLQANTAFIWFLFACFCVTLVLTFFTRTSKRRGAMY